VHIKKKTCIRGDRMFRLMLLQLLATLGPLCGTIHGMAMPSCYNQLQTTFFSENLVAEALSLYRVNQTLWRPIFNDLQRASYRIPSLLQAQARAMNPNPLRPTFIPDKAFELLQSELLAVYSSVILSYRSLQPTINSTTATGGFGYIWDKQFPRLRACANPRG